MHPSALVKEPGPAARAFVYGFAFGSPLLALGMLVVPVAVHAHLEHTVATAVAGFTYATLLLIGFRRVRIVAQRFTPPLPLPGDLWNRGSPEPPRRSANWPLRLRVIRPFDGRRKAA